MRRRALLASLPLLSGCSGLSPGSGPETRTPNSTTEQPSPSSAENVGTPEEPYTVEGAERIEPVGFGFVNTTERDQYVTIVVEHGSETVLYRNVTLPSQEWTPFESVVASLGTFHITVETSDGGHLEHTWLVRRGASSLRLELTSDGLQSRQHVTCDPDCTALDASGESVELPYTERDDATESASRVVLNNVGTESRQVDLSVGFDDETLVDYVYDLPAGITAVVPVSTYSGVYDLSVASAESERHYEWHTPEERTAQFEIDETGAIRPNCTDVSSRREADSEGFQLDEIRNFGDRPRDVTVRIDADGERVVDETVAAKPHRETYLDLDVSADERLHLVVELDSGARLDGTWGVCPDVGKLSLDVEAGEIRLLRGRHTVLTSAPERIGTTTPQ
ncbi:hypothetical protein [Halogranum rubrum]|uniref:Ig-like domain-containing protein n=1 Tax=Halogranum salarium B-1 TaxID=1210908 RepID=J3JEN3_9EURY|nr:hypothetical protein [Halogranum salarium]EJN58516.1 hypothetical protein HSB1_29940 [Halogranum salarium B-1]